ncbi:hypothetical protein HYFRA_00010125 [Hymenoscyphus fraxineus]|uniref:Amidase domain-containing protein n=1 Tax=Hymenoscyphus fraxineus TaxID=746836 RepID=A0A9N9PSG6_9HELO|nr:hypothetical protein HYFRA_00010125 [Hymenoscyphus fraxineus]
MGIRCPVFKTRTQITINEVLYLVDDQTFLAARNFITSRHTTDSFIPTTIINVQRLLIDEGWLKSELNRMDAEDDVFNLGFATVILFNCDAGQLNITPDAETYLKSLGMSWFESVHFTTKVSSGPYIWHLGHIFKVWRLYTDPNGAFIQPVIQSSTEIDRCYYDPPTPEKPLSGLRLAIKEIYDLKGVRTGCSVRDFLNLYPPLDESAFSIQKLIDHGAIVVGKTKTTQFASGEGSMDWVDYQCSFNPRGDGYQDTSMSSVGSAAGLASYDWIDSTLGTDSKPILLPESRFAIPKNIL